MLGFGKVLGAGLVITGAALGFGATGAQAGGGDCATCYRKVINPPVYSTVSETVMVRAPQTYLRHIPAEYGSVSETVMVRPEQTIAHRVPAAYRSVAETVMVSPGGRHWQVTRDAYGQEIGCWVEVPPRYATQYRTVIARPASVSYETIPAQYASRERTVVLRPGMVQREQVPGVYTTRQHDVMVSPATASWQPLRHHHGY